jgi:SOS-response transcriptional repressor LexA
MRLLGILDIPETMSPLGKRIKDVLREKGITQAELARLVGTKQQTISYIVSDQNPAQTSRYATKIAEVLGVNPSWLQTGDGDRHDPSVPIRVGNVVVRSVQVPILLSADVPLFLEGKPTSNQGLLMTDSASAGVSFALELAGNSMAPTFKEGDRVVIDTSLKPEPGDYVAAMAGDVILFRRYRQRQSGFELVPENQDWETLSSNDDIRIVGVMTEHRRYRRP